MKDAFFFSVDDAGKNGKKKLRVLPTGVEPMTFLSDDTTELTTEPGPFDPESSALTRQ